MEENRIFPDNWKEIVREKKVILYNTGVSSLLNAREKHIEKMKWVFQIFKQHPEVVLWWRPHPLEISTLQSMLPELEEQYMEVHRWYQEERIGILDESADLNRAIAISDAYYGAWSSIVGLYQAIGKPVLYENDKVKVMEKISLLPVALCVKDEDIWFIQSDSNKLIKMNRTTYETEEIISIPCEPPFLSRMYNDHIIDIGEGLLLLLEGSENLYEYEIATKTIKKHKPQIENYVFSSELVVENRNELLMFPYENSYILTYDYGTHAIEKRKFGKQNIKVAKCHEVIGSKLYMAGKASNILYCYDLSDGVNREMHIGAGDNKYWGIKKAGKYFVLPHMEKKAITLWNEENGEIIELTKFPEGYISWEEYAYFDMFESDGDVYIFPFHGNMILKVDIENKVIMSVFNDKLFDAEYEVNLKFYKESTYICVERYKEYICAYSLVRGCWQIFNLHTMNMQEFNLSEIKEGKHKGLLERLWDKKVYRNSFCETERRMICTLENYIKNLIDNYERNGLLERNGNAIGTKIYEFTKL